MQPLTFRGRRDQGIQHRLRRPAIPLALALALLLSSCGQAEQRAELPSPAPLSPAPATLDATTPTPIMQTTPVPTRPTPDETQRIASVTVAFIETSVAANLQAVDATLTAEAAWAQTPEPTILPPADTPRLRDRWPAVLQQLAPPTRLYLRSFGDGQFDPDTFWEVRLPDGQLRRLPAVEQDSIDPSAQVSPNGRYLAYVTGNAKAMERTLRVLDLAQDTDLGLAVTVTAGLPRCLQPFAWSPDGRSLALVKFHPTKPLTLLQLYDDVPTNQTPQILAELPSPLRLLGWQDADHLLLAHWKPRLRRIHLLSVDRQGHLILVRELQSEQLSCASLSPDGQTLMYNQSRQIKRLQLDTGQEEAFPWWPDDLFWVGDGHTLLISRFGTDRRVWLGSLEHLQEQSQKQSGIFLSPPYQAAYRFGIIGVSPDNHTLVACESPPSGNSRIRTRDSRTWLYSIPDDRWTLVHTSPSGVCDLVLGWSGAGGAP